jgi:hypothetical protein
MHFCVRQRDPIVAKKAPNKVQNHPKSPKITQNHPKSSKITPKMAPKMAPFSHKEFYPEFVHY